MPPEESIFSPIISKVKHPNMPVNAAHCPRANKTDSVLMCYSISSHLWHRAVCLPSNSLMHRCQHPPTTHVRPACRTRPVVLSWPVPAQPNETDRLQHPLLRPSPYILFFPLHLSRWHLDSCHIATNRPVFVALSSSHQTATQSSHCVEAILDTPVPIPRLVIPNTHSHYLRPKERIVTIVWLHRAARHQLGPVTVHTGAIIHQFHDTGINRGLGSAHSGFSPHPHVYVSYS